MSAPTELVTDHIELEARSVLSGFQWALLCLAGLATLTDAAWLTGDLVYRGHFDTPDGWWAVLLVALMGWGAFAIRCGQERIMRKLNAIIEYDAGLADRLDEYGDTREIRGHQLATTVQGNGRHLHLAD